MGTESDVQVSFCESSSPPLSKFGEGAEIVEVKVMLFCQRR
jgi:hypothetical protein